MSNKHNTLPILSGIGAAAIFGLSFLFSKMALNTAGIYELLSFRFLTAFLIMSALIALKIIKVNYKGKDIKGLLLLGLMEPIIYFIFETYGIKFSSSSIAGLMIALIPIGVVILSAYFLKEKPSALQLVFIIMSVLGVMLIGVMGGSGSDGSNLFGILLLLGAVMSAAFFTIISRKLSGDFTPMELTYSMMLLGAVFFNGVSIINHIVNKNLGSYFEPLKNSNFLISIGYLGILSSIIAYFLINFTLSKLEASKSAVVSNLATIVSIIAGVVILREPFYYYHLIGSILIIVGVWGTNNYEIKRVIDNKASEAQ
jgi:drug/metabolite transporter (DMT)-like permease